MKTLTINKIEFKFVEGQSDWPKVFIEERCERNEDPVKCAERAMKHLTSKGIEVLRGYIYHGPTSLRIMLEVEVKDELSTARYSG